VGSKSTKACYVAQPHRPRYIRTRAKVGLLFVSPAIILFALFLAGPIIGALTLSFTDFNVYAIKNWLRASFIGIENYKSLIHDPLFWISLRNTFYCAAISVPSTIVISLLVALFLNSKLIRLKSFFRLLYFLPVITNTAAMAVVWRWIFNYRFGLANWVLGLFGISGPNWLGDPAWAIPAVAAMVVWRGVGFNMVIFLAGLQGIPSYLYEAAAIDGASAWHMFRYITLPLLRPTTFFVTIMVLIGHIQLFEEPFIMTDGGPLNATLSVAMYIYRLGFRFFRLGYASSLAYVLFFIVLVITLIRMKAGQREFSYAWE
jgi:multiple sugar transport system permease protein